MSHSKGRLPQPDCLWEDLPRVPLGLVDLVVGEVAQSGLAGGAHQLAG